MATATPAQVKAAAARWLDAPHYTMVVRPVSRSSRPARPPSIARSLPPLGEAPAVQLPRRPADDAVERPVGRAARAARDADRQRRAGRRRRLRRRRAGQGRPRRARAQPARRRHDDARRLPRSSTSSTRSAPASRRAARSTCRSCGCRRCRRTSRRRCSSWPTSCCNPAFPADLVALEKRRQISQIGQEKAEPRARRCASLPRLLYGDVARLRQAVHRDRRRSDASSRSPATICCAGTATWFTPNGEHADRHRRRDDGAARAGARARRSAAGPRGEAPKKSHRHGRAQRRRQGLPDRPAGRAAVGDRRRARHRDAAGCRRISRSRRCCATSAAWRRRA